MTVLRAAFPEMKGFSPSNLKYMRAFAEAWPDFPIRQQAVGELPWGHNVVLLTKLKQEEQRIAYAYTAPEDNPTIGLLLCKSKNKIVAEYAMRDTNNPMGVAEYQIIYIRKEQHASDAKALPVDNDRCAIGTGGNHIAPWLNQQHWSNLPEAVAIAQCAVQQAIIRSNRPGGDRGCGGTVCVETWSQP